MISRRLEPARGGKTPIAGESSREVPGKDIRREAMVEQSSEMIPERDPAEAARWRFLERERDPCSVVTRDMQVVYLNRPARGLSPLRWFGCRCWEILPVGEEDCAARCDTVQVVSRGDTLAYCEETLFSREGLPLEFGVAVIPVGTGPGQAPRAVLLFRRKDEKAPDLFREDLLRRARDLLGRMP